MRIEKVEVGQVIENSKMETAFGSIKEDVLKMTIIFLLLKY